MKGIIIASFGTTYLDAGEKAYKKVEKELREKYPNCEIVHSYSSEIVRKRLRDRGINEFNMPGALAYMESKGIKDIAVLALYIIEGVEYSKIIRQMEEYNDDSRMRIKITTPLLSDREDVEKVAEVLKKEFPHNATVLMGHGSYHEKDIYYNKLAGILLKSDEHIFLGTVEGSLDLDDVRKFLDRTGEKDVVLSSFLLVAGDHAQNDMSSDDEDSWYSMLTEAGYNVNIELKGLLERDSINEMFYSRLEEII